MILKSDKERLQFDKDAYRELFYEHYSLSEADMDAFWKAFVDFGMTTASTNYSHSTAAHYYFQGIVEHCSLDWKSYGKKMPDDAREWMKNNYPQLIGVTDIAPSTI